GLNLFLYHVTPYPTVDSVEPPFRDESGKVANNPTIALDLHYIMTATSTDNDDLLAQKIIGSAMKILNEHPVLAKELIRSAIKNSESLASSNLADQSKTSSSRWTV